MKFMAPDDGAQWLRNNSKTPVASTAASQVVFEHKIPLDAGRRAALAKLVCIRLDAQKLHLGLLVTASGIWPSNENMALYYAMRRAFGDTGQLSASPWHILERGPVEHLECLLDIVLYFLWDASLFVPEVETVLRFSHDEFVEVECSSSSVVGMWLIEGLKAFGSD